MCAFLSPAGIDLRLLRAPAMLAQFTSADDGELTADDIDPTIWAGTGVFSGPLFNVGRTLGFYRASIAQWEQAKLQYEQAVLTALREVSDALTALSKLNEAEVGQDTAVRALEEAVEHATARYRQGLANYFEVLEAQQQLYPAQNTLAQIRRDRLLSHVRLYKALGGGWSLTDAQWTDGMVP